VNGQGVLLALAFATPLAMLAACLWPGPRARMPALLALAPLPALAAALLGGGGMFALPRSLLRLTFALDAPGAVLLGAAALLWSAAGWYAAPRLRGDAQATRFVSWWLLTLAGSIGVFMAADLVSFYLVFAMVSLGAIGLVLHDGTARARRAAVVYAGLAVLGEAFLLMGFVLLAAGTPGPSLLIADVLAALPASPWRGTALLLVAIGFAMKIGTVPVHVWMPLAYRAAPIAAAAVMSGAAVKAGVIGLIRFLPLDVATPWLGMALAVAGFVSAFYGVLLGMTQRDPRAVLAYSSISQMGVVAAMLGLGLASGTAAVALAASVYAAQHVLAKGGLFLALGAASRGGWLAVVLPAALVALGMAGLPLTGGAIAKLVADPYLKVGIAAPLATLSAAGTGMLMTHFLLRLVATAPPRAGGSVLPWLAVAVAAVAVPWGVALAHGLVTAEAALAPDVLWKSAWPVLAGAAVALGLRLVRLPRVPAGDVVALALAQAPRVRGWGAALERADATLRQWPVAGVALLALAVVLGVALAVG
jgi:multicomponent Na+:H+ antiporter subunit A